MRAVGVIVAIGAALALQTTLSRFWIEQSRPIDLMLVLVTYVSLRGGPVAGLLTGSVAGLAEDALSGAVVGIGGLAKTIVGFFVGALSLQFIVTDSFTRFLLFFGATYLHVWTIMGVYALIQPGGVAMSWIDLTVQALLNAVVGILAFKVVDAAPMAMERRRARRTQLSGRRWLD